MCEDCHNNYDDGPRPVHDCHGINCPLGVPHPPPHWDPKKGGVYPLGCGICRSEKLELMNKLKETGVDLNEEKPKFWNYAENKGNRQNYDDYYADYGDYGEEEGEEGEDNDQPKPEIIRPDFEFDLPRFVIDPELIFARQAKKL